MWQVIYIYILYINETYSEFQYSLRLTKIIGSIDLSQYNAFPFQSCPTKKFTAS